VLGAPNYIDSVPAPIKALFDRMADAIHCQMLTGKFGCSVCTAGGSVRGLEFRDHLAGLHFVRQLLQVAVKHDGIVVHDAFTFLSYGFSSFSFTLPGGVRGLPFSDAGDWNLSRHIPFRIQESILRHFHPLFKGIRFGEYIAWKYYHRQQESAVPERRQPCSRKASTTNGSYCQNLQQLYLYIVKGYWTIQVIRYA
jgi:hypothetical protein